MGEMIKFGIKLGLAIATAVALVASLALLYVSVSGSLSDISSVSSTSTYSYYRDVVRIITTVLPFNFNPVIALFGPLFAFKVAYWAADKMIQFIDSMG